MDLVSKYKDNDLYKGAVQQANGIVNENDDNIARLLHSHAVASIPRNVDGELRLLLSDIYNEALLKLRPARIRQEAREDAIHLHRNCVEVNNANEGATITHAGGISDQSLQMILQLLNKQTTPPQEPPPSVSPTPDKPELNEPETEEVKPQRFLRLNGTDNHGND